ncbi:hypothetical protein X738_31555 [Mesorhizobium sp. LNHC209A00]|nr:hypothetical protein X738_31555 [Mesorhizobium sp. LNHC209A00]
MRERTARKAKPLSMLAATLLPITQDACDTRPLRSKPRRG